MGKVIEFPTPNYFGDCPKCGRTDGYLNISRDHWFFCDRHMTKWWGGSNWFDEWKYETEDKWFENFKKLLQYQEVEPWFRLTVMEIHNSGSEQVVLFPPGKDKARIGE